MTLECSPDIKKCILQAQKNEITEYYIYLNLAKKAKEAYNKGILEKLAHEELEHYRFGKSTPKRMSSQVSGKSASIQ